MQTFKNLSRKQRILMAVCGLAVSVSIGYSKLQRNDICPVAETNAAVAIENTEAAFASDASFPQPNSSEKPENQTEKVVIYDQGLHMVRGTYLMPHTWKLQQDIATNPTQGRYTKYKLDFEGPKGELIRGLEVKNYSTYTGQTFAQEWRVQATAGLQSFGDRFSIGQLKCSENLRSYKATTKLEGMARLQGNEVVCWEAPLTGTSYGKPYQGLVLVYQIVSPAMPNAGVFTSTIVVCPTETFSQTMEIHKQIADSFQANPDWEQKIQQINQVVINRMQFEHRQRMIDMNSQFKTHQQRMKELNETYTNQNQQWSENFRNSSGTDLSAPGEPYTTNDYFSDVMNERTTFTDPYSGEQVQLDGTEDRTFTNGVGEFYRTNDAMFDPNALPGNWSELCPATPNNY